MAPQGCRTGLGARAVPVGAEICQRRRRKTGQSRGRAVAEKVRGARPGRGPIRFGHVLRQWGWGAKEFRRGGGLVSQSCRSGPGRCRMRAWHLLPGRQWRAKECSGRAQVDPESRDARICPGSKRPRPVLYQRHRRAQRLRASLPVVQSRYGQGRPTRRRRPHQPGFGRKVPDARQSGGGAAAGE